MALETTILISVDSVITTDGMVYPLTKSNEPDMNMGIHVMDCTEDWVESLSEKDYNRVVNRGFETCMHGRSWNSECGDCNIDEYSGNELAEFEFISKYEGGEIVDIEGYMA
jgi:hypothetical protein